MLRRTALGRSGVRRALLTEHAAVVVLSAAAAGASLLLLVPLSPYLLDPAPRLRPVLDVSAEPMLLGLLVLLGAAVLPSLALVAATVGRLRGAREEVVLRDDR